MVTNGYRGRLLDLRDTTGLAVAGLLDTVNLNARPAQLSQDLRTFRRRASTVVTNSQQASGALTLRYLAAYMTASGSGLDVDDDDLEIPTQPDPLDVVAGALFYRLGQSAGRAVAIGSAAAVAQRVARTSVQQTAVAVLGSAISASPNVSGYRRVTSSSCCERCADAASSGVYGDGEDFFQHPADRCTQEPVIAGGTESVLREAPQVVSP